MPDESSPLSPGRSPAGRDTGKGMEDPTQRRDREIVEAETEAERDSLFDLAETCSNDRSMRREAIDALRGIILDREPPPAPDWTRGL